MIVAMQRFLRFRRPLDPVMLVGVLAYALGAGAHMTLPISGRVVDTDGEPVAQARVTVNINDHQFAGIITVFTDEDGAFAMPWPPRWGIQSESPVVSARKLGYVQADRSIEFIGNNEAVYVTLTLCAVSNLAEVAPASAWLASMDDGKRARLIQNCAGCHQIPAPPVRGFAHLIEDSIAGNAGVDPNQVRRQSWDMIHKYMNALWAEDLARGGEQRSRPESSSGRRMLPTGGDDPHTVEILSEYFVGAMDQVDAYQYGAPLLATPQTAIYEYAVRRPNTATEALLLLGRRVPQLWVPDANSDRAIIRVDPYTGVLNTFEIPLDDSRTIAPHILRRAADGTMWIAASLDGIVVHFDTATKEWIKVLELNGRNGSPAAVHALSTGYDHNIATDRRGRIWFSDNLSGAVGYFSPKTGKTTLIPLPEIPGRPAGPHAGPTGLVMDSDGKKVWFSQPRAGVIGAVDTKTNEFETLVLQDHDSGPRGIAISDRDVLYAALFGTGQLLEYDTRTGARKIHDLPDRASAPHSATWDPVRKVVWIATANADAVYRFDPDTGQFAVLPLPRQAAYLRTVAVDPVRGRLTTAYANTVEPVQGPSMALIIDVGDGAYRGPIPQQSKGEVAGVD